MDLELLKKLCCLNEAQIHNVLLNMVKKKYQKYWHENEFIMAEGDIPICLLAHMDTVFPQPPNIDEFYYDADKTVLWSPYGSGFDDLAGVYIIIELVLMGYKPHLIFTHGEEIGGVGAYSIIQNFENCPFKKCKALIQLDRAHEKDCVFYNCDNSKFTRYIEKFGFVEARGTFSDISIIAPQWGIAGVNLSVGYQLEHTTSEHLNCNWTDETLKKVENILKTSKEMPYFKYIPKTYSNINDYTSSCLLCGTDLSGKHKKKHYFKEDDDFIYCVCEDCYNTYYVTDDGEGKEGPWEN